MTPAVSVCLTAFERASTIGKTIESVLAQDFPDFELLIQDDASTDHTEEVCRSYASRDSRIVYQRNGTNLGMPANLNAVISRARSPLIANLHDGDLFKPHLLSAWRAAIEKENAAFVFNQLEQLDGLGRHVRFHVHPFGPRLERGELVRYMLGRFDSPVWGTVMARRSAYEAVGLFNPRYSFYADVEMWMRLNLRFPVAYVAEPLIAIRPHEESRPYAYVNWRFERAFVAMREEIADSFFGGDPVAAAAYCRSLRRRRDHRWLRLASSCAVRGRYDLYREALEIFINDDSLLLKAGALLGQLGRPCVRLVARARREQRPPEG